MPARQNLSSAGPGEKTENTAFDLPAPQPGKGFPELCWEGKRPLSSIPCFPARLKERYGDSADGWMNRIYLGDNLRVMGHLLKEFRGKVDLAYIDPPFDSKADYKKNIVLKGSSARSAHASFEEKQYSDIWVNAEYLQFIYERLILIRELLSNNACIFVHCDFRVNYLIRAILEEIFGPGKIVNEIIWWYKRWSGAAKSFQRMHDTIFYYKKGNDYTFNVQYQKYSHPDAIEDTVRGVVGGKLVRLKDENGNFIKRTLENKGVPCHDVFEIQHLQPTARERTEIGYPTQKPEKLLERIILASSNPGSLVLDCFMGSGTTQAVAMKSGRRFIGADVNPGAVQTATRRLNGIIAEKKKEPRGAGGDARLYLNFEVYSVNDCALAFKEESEAEIVKESGELLVRRFLPRRLLRKLSVPEENVEDWRVFVETVAVDWNYDGEVLRPSVYDCPGRNGLVGGRYRIPEGHGAIRVKITDLLSESLERTVDFERKPRME
ncbi:MAG: site-specific DNA-methyltransferase [Desulfovibrio sp.]|jgi:site-specific DNA-methyltransferase (adenine-specific)/adenine-specific DNA-methyltransferase|nr:site-specific DNA-methyltransferase [Desulfovibrio sp.]